VAAKRHSAKSDDTTIALRNRAYADYVQDQLEQNRTTADHAQALRNGAAARIAAVKKALSDAGVAHPQADDSHDDSLDQYHVVERMLDERAYYPPHDKRSESPEYAKVHHQMTVADDKHCLVCGVTHSTLGDVSKNPFGAIQMETHHHTIEWALANAIDPAKFNQHILPGLRRALEDREASPDYAQKSPLYKEFDAKYAADMSADDIKAWVDHAADNLWVLCDVHHRHKYVGIHAITYPIWGPQDVVDATTVAEELKLATSTKANV
jgi:hypothetical protein